MKITISIPEAPKTIVLHPGDSVDFKDGGLLVYYDEPEASAMRILQRESIKRVQAAIKFTVERIAKENQHQ